MTTVLIAAAIVAVALIVAAAAQRRKPDAPTTPSHSVPEQLDRADFDHPDAPWLLVVFTSATCNSCAAVLKKARKAVAISPAVELHEVEVGAAKALHDRYNIDAVPTTVVVDGNGVVQTSFLGPIPREGLHHQLAELGLAPPPDDSGTSVSFG